MSREHGRGFEPRESEKNDKENKDKIIGSLSMVSAYELVARAANREGLDLNDYQRGCAYASLCLDDATLEPAWRIDNLDGFLKFYSELSMLPRQSKYAHANIFFCGNKRDTILRQGDTKTAGDTTKTYRTPDGIIYQKIRMMARNSEKKPSFRILMRDP